MHEPVDETRTLKHPVVAVGASAGGVEALKTFVSEIPADTPASFIILQHLAPDHESQLADILARATSLPVLEADENMPVESGSIYVLTPGRYLTIVDHGLFVEPPTQPRGLRLPIDHFMRSLADTAGPHSVGVILSGTGSDGSAGLKAIKGAGGVTLAQEPQTALYDGMPSAAINAGVVDKIGAIEALCAAVVEIAHRMGENGRDDEFSRTDLNGVLALLKARMGHDFAAYKGGTIGRRLRRRMNLLRFDDLSEYIKHLRDNSDEMHHLFDDLLINVTRFFRDEKVWEPITKEAIAPLLKKRSEEGEPVRVWVPACSSGEEAYSIAILLDEQCTELDAVCDWQIFATDLDVDAVLQGRESLYRGNIADDVSPERLQKYFQREGSGYRIRKHLREKVVFAQQNVLTDPPFSRLDLISCRNLLIYLDNKHQDQLLETFHFALRDGGFLVLGTSETTGSRQSEFRTIDSKAHLYARKPGRSLARLSPRADSALGYGIPQPVRTTRRDAERDLGTKVRRSLVERYAPAAIVTNANGEILHFQGPVRRFIDVPDGPPTHLLFDILPAALRTRARKAIKSVAGGDAAHRTAMVPHPDRDTMVCIECVELPSKDERLFLLTLIEEGPESAPKADNEEGSEEYVRQLENEISIIREDLQTTVEELETSNEELKASHEEAVASNEELQSANEELETNREELQSLNEELVTVNNQLEEKISEVEKTSDDMSNLLKSTQLPVLFLDSDFNIRGFTPSARELVELRDGDIGRPIRDLAFKADDPALFDDVDRTLSNLSPVEKEIGTEDAKTFIRRIQPYRTSDERIQGVVITYSDITKQAEVSARLAEREKQQRIIAELGQKGLAAREMSKFLNELCATLRVALDCDFAKVLEYNPENDDFLMVGGAGWKGDIVGEATVPGSVGSQAGYTAQEGSVLVDDMSNERRFDAPQLLVDHDVSSGISCPIEIGDQIWGVLGLHDRRAGHFRKEDLLTMQAATNVAVSAIKQITRERRTVRESLVLNLAIKTANMGVWQYDVETGASVWDERLRQIIGQERSREKPTGDAFFEMVHEEDRDRVRAAFDHTIETGGAFSEEFRFIRPDGEEIWLIGMGERIVESGKTKVIGINADITERKRSEEQSRFVMRELDHRVKNILAIILSIAKMTGANAPDFQSFIASFEKRLHSMARTHSLLAEARWHGTQLRSLVMDELGQTGDESQVRMSGPSVDLSPASAQSFSMALHELVTNALKYGSLSSAEGRLDVSWGWEKNDAGDRLLKFSWKESGGPTVSKPKDGQKGFGTTVIERMLTAQMGARTEIRYDREGLKVDCAIPADRLLPTKAVAQIDRSPAPALPKADLAILKDAHILVVDDEWLVAEQHAQSLTGAGATVIGPYHSMKDARNALESNQLIDAAVLDFNIDGTPVTPVALELEERGVPILIVSGYGSELDISDRLDEQSFMAKPVSPAVMMGRLAQILEKGRAAANGQT